MKQVSLIEERPMFDYYIGEEDRRVEAATKFVMERHRIYLKKTLLKKPKPWTDDTILRNYSFCNVYRELDKVSIWIRKNIITPYEKNENLAFMLCIARLINWPETLQEMMDKGVWPEKTWNPKKVYEVLSDRADRGEKTITGAYIVNSVFPKGVDPEDKRKVYYIPYHGLDPVWKNYEVFRDACQFKRAGSMAKGVSTLSGFHGWGPFMANQVIVDLSYSNHWLEKADDYNTFTSPGPGTTRGMNWMISGKMDGKVNGKNLNAPMIYFRDQVNACLREKVPKKWWTDNMETGFQEISMSNYSNVNCELAKMVRSINDGGTAMKTKYKGA